MSDGDLLSRITIRPEQCHGQPCIRGMRMRVVDILQMLAAGMTREEILSEFLFLESDDIRAAVAYAAKSHVPIDASAPPIEGLARRGVSTPPSNWRRPGCQR